MVQQTIDELEEAFHTLSNEDSKKKSTGSKHKGDKDKQKDHGKHIHGKEVFGIFKRCAQVEISLGPL